MDARGRTGDWDEPGETDDTEGTDGTDATDDDADEAGSDDDEDVDDDDDEEDDEAGDDADDAEDDLDLDDEAALEDGFPRGDGTADVGGTVDCPYCGEVNEIALDPGGGAVQQYVEDCHVCCRPWRVVVRWLRDGSASIHLDVEG